MENASKALMIAASTLIAVILMSFMAYMFKKFGVTAKNTEKRYSSQEIEAFNNKFINYDTGGTHSINDRVLIYYNSGNSLYSGAEKTIGDDDDVRTYKMILDRNGAGSTVYDPTDDKKNHNYVKALVTVSQSLNTVYDVVTAVNDAIDVNYKNSNAYSYGKVEVQNSVEVLIDLGSKHFDFNKRAYGGYYRYLVVEPKKDVEAKHVYGIETALIDPNNKLNNVNNFHADADNQENVYDMLKELRQTKVVTLDYKEYTVYQYYFLGEVTTNSETGLVESVKFKLVEDKNFSETSVKANS